jgi:hydrogenase nickel incorporation protein HypA/HybF
MHELSIAISVVEMATQHALSASAKSVSQVELDIGELSGVEMESLRFALSVAVKDTILESTQFLINAIHPLFECTSCGCHYVPDQMPGTCPECGQGNPQLIEGNELQIKSLLIE